MSTKVVAKSKTATKRNRAKSKGTARRRKVSVKARNARNVNVVAGRR